LRFSVQFNEPDSKNNNSMKDVLNKGLETLKSASAKISDDIASGFSIVKDKINGLPIWVSLERTDSDVHIDYDEKHYFVIPFKLSEHQFALHTMRCLPKGVPEVNNLPKRRVFHFPNEHAEHQLREYMLSSVGDIVRERSLETPHSLESLANEIDALDKKLTYGMLLVGGLAALVNPLVGAGIAAKAMLPSVTGLLSKYGLRLTGEKLSAYQLNKEIEEAQKNVIEQFEESSAIQVINPILQELELALETTESEHDPLLDFDLSTLSIPALKNEHWRELTQVAITHVYKEVVAAPHLHEQAELGPEDIRWLKLMFEASQD